MYNLVFLSKAVSLIIKIFLTRWLLSCKNKSWLLAKKRPRKPHSRTSVSFQMERRISRRAISWFCTNHVNKEWARFFFYQRRLLHILLRVLNWTQLHEREPLSCFRSVYDYFYFKIKQINATCDMPCWNAPFYSGLANN